MSTTKIVIETIASGDEIGVRDGHHNFLRGHVRLMDGDLMVVEAFGVLIPFARRNKMSHWVEIGSLHVVEHQPPLELW